MATLGGAVCVGQEKNIGSIEVGKRLTWLYFQSKMSGLFLIITILINWFSQKMVLLLEMF